MLIDTTGDQNTHVKDAITWMLGRIRDLLISTIRPDVHLHPLVSTLVSGLTELLSRTGPTFRCLDSGTACSHLGPLKVTLESARNHLPLHSTHWAITTICTRYYLRLSNRRLHYPVLCGVALQGHESLHRPRFRALRRTLLEHLAHTASMLGVRASYCDTSLGTRAGDT